MMTIAQIMEKMIAFSEGNVHDITHLSCVWTYAKTIGELEGLDADTQFILEVAAITHDIACPLCRKKYGNTNGKYQEQEGAPLVREFLADTGMTAEQIDRVAYLVGHHHSPAQIDGIDYRGRLYRQCVRKRVRPAGNPDLYGTYDEDGSRYPADGNSVWSVKMIQKHCFECGTALIEEELEEEGIVPYCPKCQQYRFPMYNVAVSMIVVDEETGKILLIQQYGKPSYILVAGYVNRGEAEEHAVVREVREETGLEVEHLRFNRTKFFEPSNTLMCNFTAFVRTAKALHINHEVDRCKWFTPQEARENIRPNSLAAEFLNAYLDEVGNKPMEM
ncbi:NUDIX domain-containing protein [Faecalibacterium duncaniae]|uniref:NUDIX domain-containing protein n=2 Tax=Oscillospiraceae TaxID=216572 RepID=UPI001FAAB5F8|nr:NUDIX domain-containing protein [Faecalibacterium prausnitzii]